MKIAVRGAILLGTLVAAVPASAIRPPPRTSSQKAAEKAQQQPQPAPQPQVQTQGGVRPSAGAMKAIVDLQTAVNANDVANIPARVAAAQAAATTAGDRYLIGQLQLRAAVNANNNAAASAAVDAIAASGQIAGPEVAKLYSGLAVKLYKEKQFGESARMFERAVALNPADQGQALLLGDAQLAAGNKSGAMATYQKVIQARRAAGQKPDEELYRRIVQAAYDAQLPSATELAREWVVAYPSPASWRNSIAIYRNLSRPDVEGALDLFRLMRATGALTNGTDLTMYLSTLNDQSNFVEAQTALEQTNVTGGDGQLQVLASSLKSKPRPSEADLAAAAKNAQSAMSLLRIGDRLYGMGAYAKAADVYRQAKGKGVEADLANLRTGIALAGAGDKAGATAALKSVGGARAGVAQLWLLYLEKKA